jgi:hypothetical protein
MRIEQSVDERQERRESKRINENQAFSPVRKWAGATQSSELFSCEFFSPPKKKGLTNYWLTNFFFFVVPHPKWAGLKKVLNFFE